MSRGERDARPRLGAHLRRGDAGRARRPRCRRWPRRRGRSARRRSATAARSAATSARPRRPATRCRRCSSRTPRCELASVRGARRLPLAEFLARRRSGTRSRPTSSSSRSASTPSGAAADVHEGRAAERDGDRRLLARLARRPRARRAPRGVRLGRADRAALVTAPLAEAETLPRARVAAAASPIDDVRGTAAYRRHALARARAARASSGASHEDRADRQRRARARPTPGPARACSTCCASGSACRARRTRASRASAARARCSSTASSSAPASCSPRRRTATRCRRSRGSHADDGLHRVQQAFVEAGAVQCGFCTPGLVVATVDLLERAPSPSDDEIREALSGNLCRCTGYAQDLRRRAASRGARVSATPTTPESPAGSASACAAARRRRRR